MKKVIYMAVLIAFFPLCLRIAYELMPATQVSLSDIRGTRFFVVVIEKETNKLSEQSYEAAASKEKAGLVLLSVPLNDDYFCVQKSTDDGFCYRAKLDNGDVHVDLKDGSMENYRYIISNGNIIPIDKKIFGLKSISLGVFIFLCFTASIACALRRRVFKPSGVANSCGTQSKPR